jgi:hypothetical protein
LRKIVQAGILAYGVKRLREKIASRDGGITATVEEHVVQ